MGISLQYKVSLLHETTKETARNLQQKLDGCPKRRLG